jgi:hypothetical protein
MNEIPIPLDPSIEYFGTKMFDSSYKTKIIKHLKNSDLGTEMRVTLSCQSHSRHRKRWEKHQRITIEERQNYQ